jgi:hypothetical protein
MNPMQNLDFCRFAALRVWMRRFGHAQHMRAKATRVGGRATTSYEIIVYAPSAPPRTVHMGTSEADMHSHFNAVEGTLQATCATGAH